MITKLNSIQQIASFLRNRGENLKPLNSNQIGAIETMYNLRLPLVYKQFLNLMGNGAGQFMKGSSVFYNEIFDLKEWSAELIKENNLQPIPNNGFVFWMHQGYQLAYFIVDEGDDPPVYFFSEGNSNLHGFRKTEDSLTAFFVSQLKLSFDEFE